MRLFNELVFDGYVTSTFPVRTSPLFHELLAEAELLTLQATCDEVQGSPAVLSVFLEHSPDGENWVAKTAPIPAAALVAGASQLVTGADPGLIPSSDRVRLRLAIAGNAPSAHVRLFASGRNTARVPGIVWCADFTALAPGAVTQLPSGLGFQRASTATVQTSVNTVQTLGIGNDVARAGNDGVHVGLVFEESRTNAVTVGRQLSKGNLTGGFNETITNDYIAGPDGQVLADRVQLTSGGASDYYFIATSTSLTFSLWGRGTVAGVNDTWVPAVEQAAPDDQALYLTSIGTSWQKRALTRTCQYCIPCDARSVYAGTTAGPRDVCVDLVQVELNALFATEYIDTNGVTVTRAGDLMFLGDSAAMVDKGRLSLEIRLQPKGGATQYASPMRLWTIDGSNYAEIDSTTRLLKVVVAGTAFTASTAMSWSAGDTVEIFVESGGNALLSKAQYRVNGGPVTVLGTSGSAQVAVLTGKSLFLLCSSTANEFSAWVQWAAAYATGTRPAWAQ